MSQSPVIYLSRHKPFILKCLNPIDVVEVNSKRISRDCEVNIQSYTSMRKKGVPLRHVAVWSALYLSAMLIY
jgi:hypothetical protein